MTLLLLLPAFAAGPRPTFVATATGEGVDLDLRIYERGEPGMGDVYDLARLRDEEVYPLLTDHTFTPDEATSSGTACYEIGGDTGFEGCDVSPDECSDCDGDGTPECTPGGECVAWYGFVVSEACVLPGAWDYELAAEGASGSFTTAVTVEDAGQDCADSGTGDSGSDGGDDTGDSGTAGSDGGCACGTAGGGRGPALLGLLGAAALVVRRRR